MEINATIMSHTGHKKLQLACNWHVTERPQFAKKQFKSPLYQCLKQVTGM